MTFEEALELKNNTNINDYLYLANPFILVVPKSDDDMKKYIEEFRTDPKTDDRAKLFSKNNQFGVFIFYYPDISFLAYKDITVR
jgi:hypothetical protein